MILEIYRGNGITELIEETEYEQEKLAKSGQQDSGHVRGCNADDVGRSARGTVRGYFIGRDGSPVVFDHLLHSGRNR